MIARKANVKINIDKYPTTFFYEKMKILPDDFTNDTTNNFFKEIVAEKRTNTVSAIKPKDISDKIVELLKKICDDPNKVTPHDAKKKPYYIGVDCINIIGNHILQYNINKLWYTNINTIFLFPIISTSSDRGEKLLLKPIPLYQKILQKKEIFGENKCINGAAPASTNKPEEKTDNQKGLGNTLEYLNLISEDDEDIETFKLRLKNNLDEIKQRIEAREDADNAGKIGSCRQYNKIIFFVNKINGEEDPMFIKYYKKGLKKEFVNALKEQLNKFFNTNPMGRQPVTYNNSLPDTNNIEKLTKDSIISKLKNSDYGYEQSEISEHIDNIQLLLEKFKMFYKRETDENYRKSITSSDNSDIFNIFMRFNNLDTPVITDDIIANRDTLYLFKEKDKKARIGYFYLSNLEKQQYIFNLDLIENKKYKDLQKSQLLTKDDKKDEDEDEDDREAAEIEESLIINPLLEIKDSTRKILVEVKLEFGKLIFRNIQKNIRNNYDSLNEITYFGQRKGYDYYRWFNHRMIDTSLTDNINIRFFKDTIYDVKSFKAYLESEKKLLKDTRVPLEFLKINASPEILKYNDYIFNNFKGNINPRLYLTDADNYSFEEKIKKGIVDILFERNSLVYIKDSKQVSEKEKEAATPQNYKIIKYKFIPIFGKETNKLEIIYKHFKEKVTTTVNETEINYYKNWSTLKSYNETKQTAEINEKQNEEKTGKPLTANPLTAKPLTANPPAGTKAVTFDPKDNMIPTELLTQMANKKKTLGILIVDVSKDVFGNPVSLYLAAECKTRSKRLKDTYYNIKKYFRGGTNKKKRIKLTKKNIKKHKYRNKNRIVYKSRSKTRPKFRRI